MPTERLYFDDPTLLEFRAVVEEVSRHDGRPTAVLDCTAFYPTGGGQPHDTGELAGVRVVDVLADAGTVHHVLEDEPGFGPGDIVEGLVDRARRLDHMQQHSGQHLLSAAFVREAAAETRSFHLGAETSTIDLALLPEKLGDLRRIEEAANLVIREDRPMSARIVDEKEALTLPLRKEVAVEGPVRVVSIEEFDMSPCGGTHIPRTGAIGMLAILGGERHRGGTRVEFVAGDRVRRLLHALGGEAEEMGAQISAPRGERVATLGRLLEERRAAARRLKDLAERVAGFEAERLAAASPPPAVIRAVMNDRGDEEVGAVARALASLGRVSVLGQPAGDSSRVVVAGPGSPDVGAALREVAARFSARGGGGPRFAQAGGLSADALEELIAELCSVLEGG